jgi:hypothetical protein
MYPYDQEDFAPQTKALLALIRKGANLEEADGKVLAFLKDDMPADLKALLHSWALKRGSYLEIGKWRLERRALGRAENALDGMEYDDPDDAIDPERAVVVGSNGRFPLLATWSAGGKVTWFKGVDAEYGKVHSVGKIKDLIEDAVADLEAEGKPIEDDLAALVELTKQFQ